MIVIEKQEVDDSFINAVCVCGLSVSKHTKKQALSCAYKIIRGENT